MRGADDIPFPLPFSAQKLGGLFSTVIHSVAHEDQAPCLVDFGQELVDGSVVGRDLGASVMVGP
jgi:hypothetical protein